MPNTMQAAGELLTADESTRTLTYRLLPFDEPGRTSLGVVTASAGAVRIPEDVSAVTMNLEHDYRSPLGRAASVTEEPDHIRAAFHIARTRAGDDLLAEASEGLRTGVSVELANPVIRDGRLISADLTAAAACVRPAYDSARLVASDTGELPTDPTDDTTTEEEEEDMPEDERTEAGEAERTEEVNASAQAKAPATLNATRKTKQTPKAHTVRDVAQMLADVAAGRASRSTAELLASEDIAGPEQLFAALSDIKYDGTGGLAPTIRQPQWIGQLWSGKRFARRVIPHYQHADLTDLVIKGWKWGTKPAMASWTGNKTAVPSGTVTVDPAETTAKRLAGAHDHAREYRDFPNPDYWQGYFEAMTDSYAELSDDGVLADLLAAATAVTRGTVPTGVDAGLVSIVDGALQVVDYGLPSVAHVAKNVWRSILLTPKDKILEYLSSSLGFEEGQLAGFRIVPHPDLTTDQVLVGAREAATVHELPGAPIRVEGLDMVKGGVDTGLFGYYATRINEAGALALVTPSAG